MKDFVAFRDMAAIVRNDHKRKEAEDKEVGQEAFLLSWFTPQLKKDLSNIF